MTEVEISSGIEEFSINLAAFGETSKGSARVQQFSNSERMRRAIKVGAIGLGATIVALLIPFAHFFLVPLGLLITPLVALYQYSIHSTVRCAGGPCPCCGTAVELTDASNRWPLSQHCVGCRRQVQLSRA